MRIRTEAFGQLYSLDFQYSITPSTGFDTSICIEPPKIYFICLLSLFLDPFNYFEVELWVLHLQLSRGGFHMYTMWMF